MSDSKKSPSGHDVASAIRAATDPPSDKDDSIEPQKDTAKPNKEVTDGSSAADPQKAINVRYFGATDVGLVREHNEDNFLVADLHDDVRDQEGTRDATVAGLGLLLAVADGMGGAAAGEVASQMAVDTVHEVMASFKETTTDRDVFARRLVRAVEEAGQRIFERANHDRSQRGMGTTATVAAVMDAVLFVGQVGDSRAYLLRGGELKLITKDQSLVNQLIEAGQLTEEEAEAFEHSNIILQALGTTEDVVVDLTFIELRVGDRLMLCSDGLSGLVHLDMMQEVLAGTESLEECTAKLIEMARDGGGHDNITCVCADFSGEGLRPTDPDATAFYQQYPLPPEEDGKAISLPPRPPPPDPRPSQRTLAPPATARGQQGNPATPWLIVFVLAIIGAFILFFITQPEPVPAPLPIEQATATLIGLDVMTDFEAEIYIDGEFRVALKAGEQTTIKVMPGARHLEAKSGGETVATDTLEVTLTNTKPIHLVLPEGSMTPDGSPTSDAQTP